MTETWRPVVGWEGWYEVSHLGNVRGTSRTSVRSDGTTQTWPGRSLRLLHRHDGYVCIHLSRPGKRKMVRVHRLVGEAFLEPAHTTETINHKNGSKSDNRVVNLEWATRTENTNHSIQIGLGSYTPPFMPREKNGQTKLLPSMLPALRELREQGLSYRKIAKHFGVTHKPVMLALRIPAAPVPGEA